MRTLAVLVLALLAGCAGTPPDTRQAIGWGALIALDVDALRDGSTAQERQQLREDAADALVALSGNNPTVVTLAPILRQNGVLTAEQKAELLAALQDKPVLQTLASLTIEFIGPGGAFKVDDWRDVARALARWAATNP